MDLSALLVVALIGTVSAAPWRCYRTTDGSTVCFGELGKPVINPPSICINRPGPPCTGPATIFTPCPCPCPSPCPSPCPAPCPPPCDPCPCSPCDPCAPCNPCLPPCDPCPCSPCNPCEPCNPCPCY